MLIKDPATGIWVNTNKPGGRVFFVGGGTTAARGKSGTGIAASDSNDGQDPNRPLATVAQGHTLATAGRGDTIVLLPGSVTITAAIAITKDDVTLRGYEAVSLWERPGALIVSATDANMVTVDANNVTIEYLTFDCNIATATANQEIIQLASTGNDTHTDCTIRRCFFDFEGADTDIDCIRIGLDSDDIMLRAVIEECVFHDLDQDGIDVVAESDEVIIRGNLFRDTVTANAARYHIQTDGDNGLIDSNVSHMAGTANIATGAAASTTNIVSRNTLWARGADTIGIQARVAADTIMTSDNMIMAAAAGNLIDFTTTSTSPSGDSGSMGNTTATNPTISVLITPTVGGT